MSCVVSFTFSLSSSFYLCPAVFVVDVVILFPLSRTWTAITG